MKLIYSAMLSICLLPLLGAKNAKKEQNSSLHSYKKVVETYNFVGDFSTKEETREISDEIFWKYPLTLPAVDFPILYPNKDEKEDFPMTIGQGKPYDHLNRGRQYFLSGDIENARLTWLGGKKRYGTHYDHHRRNDYFIASTFLLKAKTELDNKKGDYQDSLVKSLFDATTAFLSFAFIVKEQDPSQKKDELVERIMPKGLYNLAAIYWKYNRHSGAFGAADMGLQYLRKTGKVDFRGEFHRIIAEAHIKNRSYLDAIQSLDLAIRQDSIPEVAAASLTRAGDIYFDLNNYELAEDVYNLAAIIDEDLRLVNATQLVMRGESLFWLGKFSESQKILHYALNSAHLRRYKEPLSYELSAWAALRFADGYLARHEYDKARLEYYKVRSTYRNHTAGKIAQIRETCLELPYYTGKNVGHARELIDHLKGEAEIPPVLQELSWSCQVASYTSRERTEEMLNRVRDFAMQYPDSKFLRSFVVPVTAYQKGQIKKFIEKNDYYSAIDFYEKNRTKLFQYLEPETGQYLFKAYMETQKPRGAISFWRFIKDEVEDDQLLIEKMLVLQEYLDLPSAEIAHAEKWDKELKRLNEKALLRKWNLNYSQDLQTKLGRIKRTSRVGTNAKWLLNILQSWTDKNQHLRCDGIIPLLSQILEMPKVARENVGVQESQVKAILLAMTDAQFPDIFKDDESCAISILDLLAKVLNGDPKAIHDLIIRKRDWPLVAGYLNWVWIMSEWMEQREMKLYAENLWKLIVEKAADETIEKKFAAQRLQKERTQFEMLWQ